MGALFVITSEGDKIMASLIVEQAIQAREDRFAAIQLQSQMAEEIKKLKAELEQIKQAASKEA